MSQTRCLACTHPARIEIDRRLADPDEKLSAIGEWLAEAYPDQPVVSRSALSRHRANHLERQLMAPATLTLTPDGRIVDDQGHEIEQVGPYPALRLIITLGVRNALADPKRISIKDVIEAARMLKTLGGGAEDFDELQEFLANTIAGTNRRGKRRRRRARIETVDPAEDAAEGEFVEMPVPALPARATAGDAE